jgi:uncharacterized membrane protein YphA (DoxX/SURF4 family)
MSVIYNRIAGQSVERLAALSDGIFGVAMTLLLLDLKAPVKEMIHNESDLIRELVLLSPSLLVYLMSFITLGYKARWGAVLLIMFLVPVTYMMHNFWAISDPMAKQMQMIMFMKNVSMLGAALMIAYFGTGPLSLDKENGK